MNQFERYDGKFPAVGENVYIAPGAAVIGDVRLERGCSVWFNCVLRGDINHVHIGEGSNIQDLSVCHVADDLSCDVGNFVTVGHRAILHGCRIGNEVLIGMGAIVMNGVNIGDQCIIGAGSLLTEGLQIPAGSLVYGAPAKVVSQLGSDERKKIRYWAEKYQEIARRYLGDAKS